MARRRDLDALVARIRESVGDPVFQDTTGVALSRESRESWIDLQGAAVALAAGAADDDRRELARALLDAIVHQPCFGADNPLSREAFALLFEGAPEELAASLRPQVGHTYGGGGYLRARIWSLRGPEGARWLEVLARADPRVSPPSAEIVSAWTAEEWSARLDVVACLPVEPPPALVALPLSGRPPRTAMPAVVRVVIAHAEDERDGLLRFVADRLRAQRTSPEESIELFDWEGRHNRPELFRWLLELSGDAGARPPLVSAAVRAGAISEADGAWLGAGLERPAWADREVPWQLDRVFDVGEVRLPAGQLTGGDPWWTGGVEGFPWTIDVPSGSYSARIATASHPLEGSDCAALELLLDRAATVERWSLVAADRGYDGYHVEIGVASLGAPAAYGGAPVDGDEFFSRPRPAWDTVDRGVDGTLVLCSVRPQHQLCRTWVGTASGEPVAVVTDLGLLALDFGRSPSLPWR